MSTEWQMGTPHAVHHTAVHWAHDAGSWGPSAWRQPCVTVLLLTLSSCGTLLIHGVYGSWKAVVKWRTLNSQLWDPEHGACGEEELRGREGNGRRQLTLSLLVMGCSISSHCLCWFCPKYLLLGLLCGSNITSLWIMSCRIYASVGFQVIVAIGSVLYLCYICTVSGRLCHDCIHSMHQL